MKKIVYIINHHAPYIDPLIFQLHSMRNVNLTTISLYDEPTTHPEWNINFEKDDQVRCIKIPVLGDLHLNVIKIIKSKQPDLVVVSGHYPLINTLLISYCVLHHINYLYKFDTVQESNNPISRYIQRKSIVNATGLFINGKKTIDFLKRVGIETKLIIKGGYCLDIKKESSHFKKYMYERDEMRKKMAIKSNEFVFLFVGKVIPSRRIYSFLKNNIVNLSDNIRLLIIGDGPESEIIDSIKDDRILHIEKVEYSDIYRFYAIADAYFHPGKEPYSLALVQAVIAKLPIVTSNDVGAAMDYVIDGKNGYIIKNNEITAYSLYMNKVYMDGIDSNYTRRQYELLVKESDLFHIANEIININ